MNNHTDARVGHSTTNGFCQTSAKKATLTSQTPPSDVTTHLQSTDASSAWASHVTSRQQSDGSCCKNLVPLKNSISEKEQSLEEDEQHSPSGHLSLDTSTPVSDVTQSLTSSLRAANPWLQKAPQVTSQPQQRLSCHVCGLICADVPELTSHFREHVGLVDAPALAAVRIAHIFYV